MTKNRRLYIHSSELAMLEDCSQRTATRRLKRIKTKGRVTFLEYAKSRGVELNEVLKTLNLLP